MTKAKTGKPAISKATQKSIIKIVADAEAQMKAEKAARDAEYTARIEAGEKNGEAWAACFLARGKAGNDGCGMALRGAVWDAERLFKDSEADLDNFYGTLESVCFPAPRPSENRLIVDELDVGDCLRRAQQFAAFLTAYAERREDCEIDGEDEGHAMALDMLNEALKKIGDLYAEAQKAAR